MAVMVLNLGENKWLSLIKQSVQDKGIPKTETREVLTVKEHQ